MHKLNSIKSKVENIHVSSGASPIVKRIRGTKLQKIIMRIAERDMFICQVCKRFTINGVVDHIIPLHRGGAESDFNRQWICEEPCHRLKSEKEEEERNG